LNGGIEVLYEVVGKGTESLSAAKQGEYLDVIGPLGNGFVLNAKRYPLNAILIAGGMGVAPLVALAENLAHSVQRIADRKKAKTYILIGGCSKEHILCEQEFKKLGCGVMVSTEDGSKGKKGLVTDLLKDLLNAIRYPLNATIYACGPAAMLKTVAKIAEAKRVPCQVSMEEHMACGVGVCLGCPVKVKNGGYKMVCKDGPVFDAKEIAW
jgi:dihydroorotate dehydrogenase electron transfer subunit